MDSEHLLRELVELNHFKIQQIAAAQEHLTAIAIQLNECAAAAGSAVLIDTAGACPDDAAAVPSSTRLFCVDLSNMEIVEAGVETVTHALQFFPNWLGSDQGLIAAVNLRRMISVYGHQLLRDRASRKHWRTISATLDIITDTHIPLGASLHETIEWLNAFIRHYLASTATSL